jgi:hypothetical protein
MRKDERLVGEKRLGKLTTVQLMILEMSEDHKVSLYMVITVKSTEM